MTDDNGRPITSVIDKDIILLTEDMMTQRSKQYHKMHAIYKSWQENPPKQKTWVEANIQLIWFGIIFTLVLLVVIFLIGV